MDIPCIRITDRETGQIWYAKNVEFLGPTKICQAEPDPENTNKVFIWIETDGPIEWTK